MTEAEYRKKCAEDAGALDKADAGWQQMRAEVQGRREWYVLVWGQNPPAELVEEWEADAQARWVG